MLDADLRRTPPAPELLVLLGHVGLTTGQVARAVGTVSPAVSNWKRGTRTPRGDQARRLDELRAIAAYLLTRDGLGEPGAAAKWLTTVRHEFGGVGKVPVDLIGTDRAAGIIAVVEALDARPAPAG